MLAGGFPCSCIQHWPNDGPASETLGRRWASAVCLLMAQCLPASAWHTLILHSSCYNLISPLRADFPDLQYDCQGIGLMQSSKLPVVFHRRRQIQLGDSSAVESHLYDPISRCDNWLLWAICPIWCFAGRRVGGAVVKLGINTVRSWRLGRSPPPLPHGEIRKTGLPQEWTNGVLATLCTCRLNWARRTLSTVVSDLCSPQY